jgi:hypothetical protein
VDVEDGNFGQRDGGEVREEDGKSCRERREGVEEFPHLRGGLSDMGGAFHKGRQNFLDQLSLLPLYSCWAEPLDGKIER